MLSIVRGFIAQPAHPRMQTLVSRGALGVLAFVLLITLMFRVPNGQCRVKQPYVPEPNAIVFGRSLQLPRSVESDSVRQFRVRLGVVEQGLRSSADAAAENAVEIHEVAREGLELFHREGDSRIWGEVEALLLRARVSAQTLVLCPP
jgi:hypothetical protein